MNLYNKKTYKVLQAINSIREIYISKISEKSDTSYKYTFYLINKFEKEKLITTEKKENSDARIRICKLTDKGRKILRHLNKIKEILN